MTLRVAIIGAGISGLVSVKQCLEAGVEPVCFEALGHFGGMLPLLPYPLLHRMVDLRMDG